MIVHDTIDSMFIANNMLDDPSERDVFVYLPPDYGRGSRRYATAYLLHWFGVHAVDLISPPEDKARWSPPMQDILDPVFRRLGTKEMIVVIPDGWTSYGCSQWVDSPVNGYFEQYLLHEVVKHVDQNYRTRPAREPGSAGNILWGIRSVACGHTKSHGIRSRGRALG